MDPKRSRAPGTWTSAAATVGVLAALTVTGPLATATWEAPRLAFASIVAITALCLLASIVVIVVGWRRRLAEIAIYGAALACVSLLPLVHGLTIPGVLYGPNTAVAIGAFAAVPLALVVAAPTFAPHHPASVAVAKRWRAWTVGWLTVATICALVLLARPNLIPAPTGGSVFAVGVALVSIAGTLAIAARQMTMYRIGRRPASLAASLGFAYIGCSMLVWLGATPYSAGWWLAHAVDAAGVLGATIGLAVAHRRDRDVVATLAPVVNRDPLIALELGLTPVVHRFIGALSAKDRVTRDHVVRVAELAMRSGLRAGLAPERLRTLGLGALLHDIGKLTTPADVLDKPGALTDDEFEVMKQHTVWGETLMNTSPLLAPGARFVRWHHERADGSGYPDGLPEDQIPFEVSLISVCDAWDAMTSDRPYRRGMPAERAMAILREHAGSQWSAAAVRLVATEIETGGPVRASVFDRVGNSAVVTAAEAEDPTCGCLDALPPALVLR